MTVRRRQIALPVGSYKSIPCFNIKFNLKFFNNNKELISYRNKALFLYYYEKELEFFFLTGEIDLDNRSLMFICRIYTQLTSEKMRALKWHLLLVQLR